jgi:small-conductance mechanosensitive channel
MNVIITLLVAIALLILLKSGWYLIKLATHKKTYYHYVLRIFPMVELGVWILFAFWMVETLFFHNTFYPFVVVTMAILLIIFIAWFVFRDLVAGTLLKASHAFEPGMFIQTADFSGTIREVGYTALELQTLNGELVKISWLKLSKQDISRHTEKGHGKSQVLRLIIPQQHDAQNIQQMLKTRLLEMPWVLAAADMSVSLSLDDDHYLAEITFHSLYDDMLPKTEELMREFVREAFRGDEHSEV